jgi:hypothetical protein
LAASILFYEADAVNRILESVWSLRGGFLKCFFI